DALRLVVDLDDLHRYRLADAEHFGRMADAAPGDVGDVQQAVDAAEIDESAVVGDVLDHAFDHLLLLQAGHEAGALLGAALFEHGAARDHDIAAAAVHLEDLEGLRLVHQRADVAHRADVDLAARKEGDRAVEIDGEAALDAAEDHAGDAGLFVEGALELDPAFLAASLVTRQDGFAQRVLDALEIDLDLVAELHADRHAGHREFLEAHASLGLQTDVDDGEIVLDPDDGAGDDGALLGRLGQEAGFEHGREVVAAGRGDDGFVSDFGCGRVASHSVYFQFVRSCRSALPANGLPGRTRLGGWVVGQVRVAR